MLTTLDLSSNYLGGERYVKASKVEGESKKVGDKVIYEGREMTVSKGVDKDGDLKVVDLSGMLAMSKALEVNRVLTTLDLSRNDLDDEAGKAMFKALEVNRVMKNLSVAGNRWIVGEAAQQLAATALGSKSLDVFSEVPSQRGEVWRLPEKPVGLETARALRHF